MRVLADGLDAVIERKLLDGLIGEFDPGDESVVHWDDGACFQIHRWMVEVEVRLRPDDFVRPAPPEAPDEEHIAGL
ncbi:MAG: hypothetical protein ACRYFU_08250 [Janthinobacterium lividum]